MSITSSVASTMSMNTSHGGLDGKSGMLAWHCQSISTALLQQRHSMVPIGGGYAESQSLMPVPLVHSTIWLVMEPQLWQEDVYGSSYGNAGFTSTDARSSVQATI
jgi:hypothetical protein